MDRTLPSEGSDAGSIPAKDTKFCYYIFMADQKIIKVAVSVFVIKNNKVLLGKRKNISGHGTWNLPSGHVEFGELLVSAAKRELKEETGLRAGNLKFLHIVNDPLPENDGTHYVHFSFLAKNVKGKPKLAEPEKCSEWEWFDLNNLPKNTFIAHRKLFPAFFKKAVFKE